ncbi:hypothetical protein ACFP6A_02365 [Quadrisphaera sp. GCM10027208]|uniref:hypothetical protein n=1 Tax=Quadrisphaera sp. GCM10027208 TaxID=3273423 RepID=UPI003616B30C
MSMSDNDRPGAPGIAFERSLRTTRYLDPSQNWAPAQITSEIRRDPLLGTTGRLAHFVGFAPQPEDFAALAATTREICPFCPDRLEVVTPQLPPDVFGAGRLRRGQATLVPNLSPYDAFSAVTVICAEHFVPIGDWSPELLVDAISLARDYAAAIRAAGHALPYTLLSWNYMPPAASTQIHPHLQVIVTDEPGTNVTARIGAQREYLKRWGRPFFDDLVETERAVGERWVHDSEHVTVLTDFVSLSALSDVRIVFSDHQVLDTLDDAALGDFCAVMSRLLRALGETGVSSFNMSFFPATADAADGGRLHAVLTPRLSFSPALHATDIGALNLQLGEPYMARSPEELATSLRPAFRPPSAGAASGGS